LIDCYSGRTNPPAERQIKKTTERPWSFSLRWRYLAFRVNRVSVLNRHPAVALLFFTQMSNAWKGQVRRCHQPTLTGSLSEQPCARCNGGFRIDVHCDGYLRMRQLHRMHVHNVAP